MRRISFAFVAFLLGVVDTDFRCDAEDAQQKAWVYKQTTGELFLNGKLVATGYSGHGKGVNNPDLEKQRNVGPIPRGEYTIGTPFKHPRIGPMVMRLTPVGHDAHGRTGFLIHGDNKKMNKSASEGCIILVPGARKTIADSKISRLIVEK